MSDIKFPDGLIVKPPHERAPDHVKSKISMHRQRLIAWLQAQDGEWVNLEVKASRDGKWYAAVDDWKPSQEKTAKSPARHSAKAPDGFDDDSVPF